jgi:choline-glycine betaine transporter
MLLVGGLGALQQAAVLGAVPLTFVVVGVAWCWMKALREETRPKSGAPPHASGRAEKEPLEAPLPVVPGLEGANPRRGSDGNGAGR